MRGQDKEQVVLQAVQLRQHRLAHLDDGASISQSGGRRLTHFQKFWKRTRNKPINKQNPLHISNRLPTIRAPTLIDSPTYTCTAFRSSVLPIQAMTPPSVKPFARKYWSPSLLRAMLVSVLLMPTGSLAFPIFVATTNCRILQSPCTVSDGLLAPSPPNSSCNTRTTAAASTRQFSSSVMHVDAANDTDAPAADDGQDKCPRGYFLNSVKDQCSPLGPLGCASQVIETSCAPLRSMSRKIGNLFGIDTHKLSELGVGFALSYSILSNINGAVSLSSAWYLSSTRTGLSPLAPGQWKSLAQAYGTIYAIVQLLRPFRVAAAIAMTKLSREFLEQTQRKLSCSRGVAIGFQYTLGWVIWAVCSSVGISVASAASGVSVWDW